MAGVVDRVKNILLSPKSEWEVIDGESGDTREVFTYVAILAAIPAIFGIIGGMLVFPAAAGFFIASAILGYLLAFVVVYLVAFIIDALAPTFNTEKHMPSALKLAAYSYTPAWVSGVFGIIPGVGGLLTLIASLYGLYLLYLGVPVLMRAPQEKAVTYTIVIVICAIIISVVIGAILAVLLGMFGLGISSLR